MYVVGWFALEYVLNICLERYVTYFPAATAQALFHTEVLHTEIAEFHTEILALHTEMFPIHTEIFVLYTEISKFHTELSDFHTEMSSFHTGIFSVCMGCYPSNCSCRSFCFFFLDHQTPIRRVIHMCSFTCHALTVTTAAKRVVA